MIKVMILIVVIFIVNILEKELIGFKNSKDKEFFRDFLEHGFISAEDLNDINADKFLDLSKSVVTGLGYKFLKEYSSDRECHQRFIYEKNASVGLIKLIYANERNERVIDKEDIKTEVGFMSSQNLKEGIIITSGEFSDEAVEYIRSLSNRFKISLVDKYSMCNKRRQLWF